MTFILLFQREPMSFTGMLICSNYNTLDRIKTSKWLIFKSGVSVIPKDKFVV